MVRKTLLLRLYFFCFWRVLWTPADSAFILKRLSFYHGWRSNLKFAYGDVLCISDRPYFLHRLDHALRCWVLKVWEVQRGFWINLGGHQVGISLLRKGPSFVSSGLHPSKIRPYLPLFRRLPPSCDACLDLPILEPVLHDVLLPLQALHRQTSKWHPLLQRDVTEFLCPPHHNFYGGDPRQRVAWELCDIFRRGFFGVRGPQRYIEYNLDD